MRFFIFFIFEDPILCLAQMYLPLCLQEYLKNKGKDVDPTLVEQMRGIIIQSCFQFFQ
jgi:hypothetical protein